MANFEMRKVNYGIIHVRRGLSIGREIGSIPLHLTYVARFTHLKQIISMNEARVARPRGSGSGEPADGIEKVPITVEETFVVVDDELENFGVISKLEALPL